jgi:DNA-binding PadR family transcriptional regulator
MKLAEGDFAVLGFLLIKPMTGYELKAKMELTIGHFNRPSYGGIYPSLNKLARGGYVSMAQSVGGGKIRKTYRPLSPGKKAFQIWLKTPPEITRGPGPLLTRIFFLGLGGRENARAFSREVRGAALERMEWLKRVKAEFKDKADPYQAATWEFGIEYYRFLQKWFAQWEEGK